METPITLLQGAEFQLKTFSEAEILADFLSSASQHASLVRMGLFELLTNAIEHGNLNISSQEKTQLQKEDRWLLEIEHRLSLAENKDKFVHIEVSRITEQEMQIIIRDQGNGFDWKKFESGNEDTPHFNLFAHGRGIKMAKELAFQKLIYSEKGNQVTATFITG